MKRLAIGMPVYKVKSMLDKLLTFIPVQSMSDDVAIILANGHPGDNV